MKKLGFILVSALLLASCGQGAKNNEAAEQARQDSIAQAELAAENARLEAELEAAELARLEAEEAAEQAVKAGQKAPAKAGQKAPETNTPAPKQEEVVVVQTPVQETAPKTLAEKKAEINAEKSAEKSSKFAKKEQ